MVNKYKVKTNVLALQARKRFNNKVAVKKSNVASMVVHAFNNKKKRVIGHVSGVVLQARNRVTAHKNVVKGVSKGVKSVVKK